MIATLKAEVRKLLTVRSTYVMMSIVLALTAILCFYFEGYKGNSGSPAAELAPTALQEIITNGAGLVAVILSIIAILFMAHEYRYNTIMYTLTANARRSQVLAAKTVVIVIFAVIFGLVAVGVALGSYVLGVSVRGAELPPQDFHALAELGRSAYYFAGYALVGIGLAVILRNITACIAILFIFSTTIEPLLSVLLKDNAKYLPFTSLDAVVGASIQQATLAPGAAMGVSALYLGVLGAVAWLLFLRRDVS